MIGPAICDSTGTRKYGWKGWIEIPEPQINGAHIPWTDLSHPITETLSRIPFFPQPRIGRWMNYPPANVTEIQMIVHHGTHFDAPRHFVADGPTIDQVPLNRLYGQGVIWHIQMPPRGRIGVAELERATPAMQRGDIVLIDTGWWKQVNTDTYEDHPVLTAEAAEWFVTHGAKLVGVDSSSPDEAVHYRSSDFNYPVHHTLLSNGVLIAEHLTNLSDLAGQRVEIMFLGINLVSSDGAPARVVARPYKNPAAA
jgi:kynurenine formamidase